MVAYKCKMCGGSLKVEEGAKVTVCEYCQTQQTIPSADDEKKANLYNRANHFRQNGEFDKAMSIYEHILDEDETDAEVYWSIVLCRYGIEYVEDPATLERKPTVNRVQSQSVLQDADYLTALEHADYSQKVLYEQEATAINEIQKEILQIAAKEKPYDIFLSYKEKAPDGQRTKTSVIAQDLYQHLTKEGYRVFFSRISLEDKVGQKYEPYIYSALNSSKVMLVLGMTREEFIAPWVKNEWTRFLNMMKENPGKVLIPCFRDITIDELPDEFQVLQSQDMGRIGAEQDILRGLSKIFQKQEAEQKKTAQTVEKQYAETENSRQRLLQNAETYIRLKDYEKARGVYQKITELYPEDYSGWWGLIRAESHNFTDEDYDAESIAGWEKLFSYVKELASEKVFEQKLRQWLIFCKRLSLYMVKNEIEDINHCVDDSHLRYENERSEIKQLIEEIEWTRHNLEEEQNQIKVDKADAEDECREIKADIHKAKIACTIALTLFVCSALAGWILPSFSGSVKLGVMVFAIGGIISLILLLYASQTPFDESTREITEITVTMQTRENSFKNKDKEFCNRLDVALKIIKAKENQKNNELNFTELAEQYVSYNEDELANTIFIRYCVEKGYDYQDLASENEDLEVLRKDMYEALRMTGDDGEKAAEQLVRKFG